MRKRRRRGVTRLSGRGNRLPLEGSAWNAEPAFALELGGLNGPWLDGVKPVSLGPSGPLNAAHLEGVLIEALSSQQLIPS